MKRKIIFLDRDGVINHNALYYTYKIEDFKINDGVVNALKLLQIKGYEFIVITNQGGISKKLFSKEDVNLLHEFMINEFEKQNVKILDVYFCPHHSELESCLCRKPLALMLEKAIARYNVDINKSYFIGDQNRDVETAKKASIKPILIQENSNLNKILMQID